MTVSVEDYADQLEPLDRVERHHKLKELDLPDDLVRQIHALLARRAQIGVVNRALYGGGEEVPADLARDELLDHLAGRSAYARPPSKPASERDALVDDALGLRRPVPLASEQIHKTTKESLGVEGGDRGTYDPSKV